ncbi:MULTISPECIES: DUF2316 family protein [unclassified Streptomyces]|uniref:DUF2316 family protein n=1 Tax=unclassified Streptomyces TaxID=2593676 RepID=UPI000DC4312C|nr:MULTISPECIES: DUF2316 family protein [unclassified Streptomyces]MYT69204.1 DUF2316 family protein [Streptomyces sp. SID8367]RAJ82719.1 hypothetical protein K377_04440 [Streptomyces sp. PsTaAH-137]
MSLNAEERRRTAEELRHNLTLTALTDQQVAADLEWTPARLTTTLDIENADPVDVWQLRDYLAQAVRDTGHEPVPFTVLTDRSRTMARAWFALRTAPRHDFTPAN